MSSLLAPQRPASLPVAVSPEDDAPAALPKDVRADVDALFMQLLRSHRNLHIEQTAEGQIVVMPPTYTDTGRKNFQLASRLGRWMDEGGGGEGFDSSTTFLFASGAKREPDVAWVETARWNAVPAVKRKKIVALCPDFVIELRSDTDRLSTLQKKMRDYIADGVRLGWLIDPRLKRVEMYRPDTEPIVLDNPAAVRADPELPGFVLELTDILT